MLLMQSTCSRANGCIAADEIDADARMCRQEHERVHQPGPSPSSQKPRLFNCQSCTKAFAKRSQLERHNRTHTGQRSSRAVLRPRTFDPFPMELFTRLPAFPAIGGHFRRRQSHSNQSLLSYFTQTPDNNVCLVLLNYILSQ